MYRSRRLLSLPFATLSVLFASVFLFGSTVSAQALTEVRPLSHNEQIILEQSQQVDQKSTVLETTSQELQTLEEKKKALADQLEAEKAKIAELKQKIADKKAAEAKAAQEAVAVPIRTVSYSAPIDTGPVAGCGDNFYANYIYMHESGCRTHNPNGSGCDGIGQACPASKVIGPCGYDYACQNAWFTNYAIERYGSWAGAYNFWLNNHWW